jgi:hypothetical protein
VTGLAAEFQAVRTAIASLPADVSSDAHGTQAPQLNEIFAPEAHAAALDPAAAIVQGSRGTGKSFWAGVLADDAMRAAAATAYPRLGLERLRVQFGFTGLAGPEGIDKAKLDACVPSGDTPDNSVTFWWATVLRAVMRESEDAPETLRNLMATAANIEQREALISRHAAALASRGQTLLIVYDALDTVAVSWPRRRALTLALFEVVWAMRAWRPIRIKLFLRPDQLDDEGLRFVELPKLRTGAVRLTWTGTDLYGLLFARLAQGNASEEFSRLLANRGLPTPAPADILSRRWALVSSESSQRMAMSLLCGQHMAEGPHGFKKGKTYDWPLKHLADAFHEVTPRSFLALCIGGAKHGTPPVDRAVTPDGIKHGLRLASQTRVDQLHQEFGWIKGVLAPLAGVLLPKNEDEVFEVWRRAGTVATAREDATRHGYLPPFPDHSRAGETDLYLALERIGVMFRRSDGRLDMPDLFRVAARLLKKGGTAPV